MTRLQCATCSTNKGIEGQFALGLRLGREHLRFVELLVKNRNINQVAAEMGAVSHTARTRMDDRVMLGYPVMQDDSDWDRLCCRTCCRAARRVEALEAGDGDEVAQ